MREMLLDRAYEHWFWIRLFALFIGGFSAFAALVYLVAGRDLGGSYAEAIYTIYTLKINIFSLLLASVYSIVIMVLTMVFIALVAIFFSHRMAGPLFRFRQEMERLASGDTTGKTSFRDRDQFAVLAAKKNEMATRLGAIVSDSARDFAEVRDACMELSRKVQEAGHGGGAGVEEIRTGIRDLSRLVERAAAGVRDLKTTDE